MKLQAILMALIGAIATPNVTAAQTTGTHYGDTANCLLASVDGNVNRLMCKFMPVSNSRNLRIEYMSGECVSTQYGAFLVRQFQIATIPNGTATVFYQLPVNKSTPINTFVNGSYTFSATQTTVYANAGTPLYALVDVVFPGPDLQVAQNIKQCTVSLAGVLTLE